jgi:hypothetical protein
VRKTAWFISLLILGCTGALGLYNGASEWKDAHTPLQKSVTGGVFLYGVLGLLGVYGALRTQTWNSVAVGAWGVIVTYVATAAVFAYGGADASTGGAIAGGVVTAVIAVGVWWATKPTTRAEQDTASLSAL